MWTSTWKAWLTEWAKKIMAVANIDGIHSIYDDDDYHQEDHDDIPDGKHHAHIDVELIYS